MAAVEDGTDVGAMGSCSGSPPHPNTLLKNPRIPPDDDDAGAEEGTTLSPDAALAATPVLREPNLSVNAAHRARSSAPTLDLVMPSALTMSAGVTEGA